MEVLGWFSNFMRSRVMRVNIKDYFSEWREVYYSSVPQGSVCGPTQFSLYINDMIAVVQSNIILFADDAKMWRSINSIQDQKILQSDLDSLVKWSKIWLLRFNSNKCKVLHLGYNNKKYEYTMEETGVLQVLKESFLEKDLGVMISSNFKFTEQCNKSAKKAMRILGMIKRNFKNLDCQSLRMLYCTYVRPHIEYCIQAWSPYFKKDIDALEKVQRRASKLIPDIRRFSYEARLKKLNLYPLEIRRLRGDLIEAYKILHGFEDVDPNLFFRRSNQIQLRGNSLKLYKKRSKLLLRAKFFSQRVVDHWNELPNDVVNASSLNSFKARLERYRMSRWGAHLAGGL